MYNLLTRNCKKLEHSFPSLPLVSIVYSTFSPRLGFGTNVCMLRPGGRFSSFWENFIHARGKCIIVMFDAFASRGCRRRRRRRRRHSTSSLHRTMTAIIRMGKLGASRCERDFFTSFIADDKFPGLPCHELGVSCARAHTQAHICIQHFYDGRSVPFLSK